MFLKISGEFPGLFLIAGSASKHLSVSLRNNRYKRLGSRPKRSIKPCHTNRTIK